MSSSPPHLSEIEPVRIKVCRRAQRAVADQFAQRDEGRGWYCNNARPSARAPARARQACTAPRLPAPSGPSGFSTKTCLPASKAAVASAACCARAPQSHAAAMAGSRSIGSSALTGAPYRADSWLAVA